MRIFLGAVIINMIMYHSEKDINNSGSEMNDNNFNDDGNKRCNTRSTT